MDTEKVRNLMEVTAPKEDGTPGAFTDAKLAAFRSGYIDSYDEALELLEHDVRDKKHKHKE